MEPLTAAVIAGFAALIGGTRLFVERGIRRRAGRAPSWPPQPTVLMARVARARAREGRRRSGNYGRNFAFTAPDRPRATHCDCGWCTRDPTKPSRH